MDRKEFLKRCGSACVGGWIFSTALDSCTTFKTATGNIVGDDLIVLTSDFETEKGAKNIFKKFIIVQNDILLYPICIYRFTKNEYAALWMRCTHQGTELQVFGDTLQCPAHGSEFTSKGLVQNGPAESKLRTFPITIEKDRLKISLKVV